MAHKTGRSRGGAGFRRAVIQWPHEAIEDPVLASLRTASSLAPPFPLAKWLRHFQASQCTRGFFGLVWFGFPEKQGGPQSGCSCQRKQTSLSPFGLNRVKWPNLNQSFGQGKVTGYLAHHWGRGWSYPPWIKMLAAGFFTVQGSDVSAIRNHNTNYRPLTGF